MRPPLYTDGGPRFYEAVGWFVCGATITFTLMALVMAGKAHSGNAEGQGVRTAGVPVGAGESGSRDLGDGRGTDSGIPAGFPPEDYAQHCEIEPPEGFNHTLEEVAVASRVNPRLLALTVYRESRCDVKALGAAGEIGLGQVHPRWWRDDLVEIGLIEADGDLWDPETNLAAMAHVLRVMDERAEGNVFEALRRYNGSGPKARRYAQEQMDRYEALWGEPLTWVVREGC